jgi:hypothetical protein
MSSEQLRAWSCSLCRSVDEQSNSAHIEIEQIGRWSGAAAIVCSDYLGVLLVDNKGRALSIERRAGSHIFIAHSSELRAPGSPSSKHPSANSQHPAVFATPNGQRPPISAQSTANTQHPATQQLNKTSNTQQAIQEDGNVQCTAIGNSNSRQ